MPTSPGHPGTRVAIVTCEGLPDGDPDDRLLADACAGLGLAAEVLAWTDPRVDWAAYDAVVLRSTWDYADRRADFLSWCHSVPRLFNPAGVVERNTDKTYLAELAEAGIPVVPTSFVRPGDVVTLPAFTNADAEVVVKPTVGAGSRGAGRFNLGRPEENLAMLEHVAELHRAGRTAMIQPYQSGVDTHGETAMVCIDGAFSHAIRKGAMLAGQARYSVDDASLYVEERIEAREPSTAERDVTASVLAHLAATVAEPLLYTRVDLLPGEDGPVVVELELSEPSLFLGFDSSAPHRLASAIASRARVAA
jgi:glutathione synthase/RimK-type ligase-like ATP-grasp enzyme